VWNAGATPPASGNNNGTGDYAAVFGTSFAAPMVSGTMSLMLSVNPGLTAEQLVAGVRLSARPHVVSSLIGACSEANPGRCICTTQTCGAGILDAEQALRYAADPNGYAAPVRSAQNIDSDELRQAYALGADLPANSTVVASADTSVSSGTSTATAPASAMTGVRVGGAGSVLWTLLLLGAVFTLKLSARHKA
jgi:serine protease